ncbi:hypothetical protein Peur_059724 [Populus x canadensis]
MAFQWCPHLEISRGDLVVGNHVFGFVIPVDFSRRTKTGKRIKFPNEWVKGELNDPENLAEWRVGDESEFLEDFKEGS